MLDHWKHAWKIYLESTFTALLLYIICLTHFHYIQKASPQLYDRLPMRFLKSTTEFIQPPRPLGSYYESKGSHETLRYQNSESRAMMNWTISSALLYRPSQKIASHYLFLFHVHHHRGIDSCICWIYLFLISLSPQYGSLLSSYLRVSPAESTLVLYVVFICRGVARSVIPTTTRAPYPLCWYCCSSC